MTGVLTKVVVAALSRVFYAFMTEKMISMVIIEVLKKLSEKTTNTLDDEIVMKLEANLNV
ncbi:hypothetical protein [Seleniivibrio sp.]|uniref:hypothetical protein n=1 Tax=Seleniivibrio sp. TaxID=2898801 RepID=UPI0025F51E9F|nr:hypothetical protein [Seleniivibrio sp.]MCD8553031.1 hypothetical protein [Seleniivibrio sp.]